VEGNPGVTRAKSFVFGVEPGVPPHRQHGHENFNAETRRRGEELGNQEVTNAFSTLAHSHAQVEDQSWTPIMNTRPKHV